MGPAGLAGFEAMPDGWALVVVQEVVEGGAAAGPWFVAVVVVVDVEGGGPVGAGAPSGACGGFSMW